MRNPLKLKKNIIKGFAFLVSLSLPLICSSQSFIGESRKKTVVDLNKYISKNNLKATLQETDTTIILFIRDSSFKPAEFIYSFDNENKCISELKKACDSCITNYYNEAIKDNSYKWVKVNSTTALSKYSKHLIVDITGTTGNTILSVRKINWPKDQYVQYLETRN